PVAVNVAVTFMSALIVTWQGPAPEHAPLQPTKAIPDAGDAVSVTWLFAVYVCEHADGQAIPPVLSETVPNPLSVTVSTWFTAGSATAWWPPPVTYTLAPSGEMASPVPPSP